MAAMASVCVPVPSPPQESAFRGGGVVQQGDLVEVMINTGSAGSKTNEVYFSPATVWEVSDGGFHLYYLTRCHPEHVQEDARNIDQLLHVFEQTLNYAPWESINLHVPLSQFEGSDAQKRKAAFKKLGFRDLGNGGLYKITEEALAQTHPSLMHRELQLGCIDSESDADTELGDEEDGEEEEFDEEGNLADLVVPESDVELFTRASGTSHAEMINRAQGEFEAWVPANEAEQRTKDMIDSIDARVSRAEATRAWAQGRSM